MKYLKKSQIILINRKTVKRHGGNFVEPYNFLNESSLDYLIEMTEAEMFDKKLYSKISDVAALYFHSIISNHIFQDGNKRTGLLAALVFLNLNGFQLQKRLSIGSLIVEIEGENPGLDLSYDFTLAAAAGKINLEECKSWFEENIIPL